MHIELSQSTYWNSLTFVKSCLHYFKIGIKHGFNVFLIQLSTISYVIYNRRSCKFFWYITFDYFFYLSNVVSFFKKIKLLYQTNIHSRTNIYSNKYFILFEQIFYSIGCLKTALIFSGITLRG